ncbi:HEAT repeat domain-containing protein [Bosea sp. BK604]|uniref:HEAT repeat domain-containing protein n=1 Tax=Bosea sp. BK604 TaxID=2512180 RepID=UPI001049EBC2|nr:HEAT repeat domain-containing protein [Bosea sp. BK604]TCR62633.1 HEAT repeat protein [Bosea sp. BK604]
MSCIPPEVLSDRRSTAELIELALVELDRNDDDPCPCIVSLQERGTRDVLDAARAQCASADPKRRQLGALILGQLGSRRGRTFPEECCDTLLDLVEKERNLDALVVTIYAFGHLGHPRAEPALIARFRHRSSRVRRGVAFSLVNACHPLSQHAVEALLQLMEDREEQVRDWATTGIGFAVEFDGTDIRNTLLQRSTQDDDEITRAEALHGLARRNDMRALPLLIAELSAADSRPYLFNDAAKTLLGIDEEEYPVEALLDQLRALQRL